MSRLFVRRFVQPSGVLARYPQLDAVPVRRLNLLEYQSKELLRDSGVSVQNFAIIDDFNKTNSALQQLREFANCFQFLVFHSIFCLFFFFGFSVNVW